MKYISRQSIALPARFRSQERSLTTVTPSSPFQPDTLPFVNHLLFLHTASAQRLVPTRTCVGARGIPSPSSAWTRVIPSAIWGPDEHWPKIVCTLVDFAVRLATRQLRYVSASESEARQALPSLEGVEGLDGMLFVCIARFTFHRLGWVNEGETASLGI